MKFIIKFERESLDGASTKTVYVANKNKLPVWVLEKQLKDYGEKYPNYTIMLSDETQVFKKLETVLKSLEKLKKQDPNVLFQMYKNTGAYRWEKFDNIE